MKILLTNRALYNVGAARRGKAIHTESDFGRKLYEWNEIISQSNLQVKI